MTARRPCFLLVLLGSGIFALTSPRSFAQETPQLIRVRAEASKEPLAPINLRPNSPTAVRLEVENPSEDGLREVTVKLVQIVNDQPHVLASKDLDKLPAKDKAMIVFAKGKDTADKKDLAKEKNGADKIGLAGPPFKIQVWIEAKLPKDFVTIKRDLDLMIREPRDYVTSFAHFDKLKSRLSFRVKLDEAENLIGTNPCKIELVLGAELAMSKKGTYKQQLTASKQPVDLFADDAAFAGPKIREGRAYLTVDGYERAFTYPVTLTGSGDLDEVPIGKKIGARIVVPRFAKPDAKFKVQLELDGPLDAAYRVELGLDRAGMKDQFQTVSFTGLRRQKIGVSISAAGHLIWTTEVQDWQAEFDTTGVYGDVWFRVRVLKKDGKSGKEEEVELVYPQEAQGRLAVLEADGESHRLYARVSQDESQPEEIEVVDLPKQWPAGKPLPLVVKVRKRGPQEAPIDKVVFLRGKIPADGKLGPDAVLGVGDLDAKAETWSFLLPPQEKTEAFLFTVQATTQTGISAAKVASLAIAPPSKGLAKIKGIVAHGELPQPGRPVALLNKKGEVLGSVKTVEGGEYVFDKVPPGEYVVRATMSTPALVGQTAVVVPEGADLIDNVKIKLMAK